MTALIWNNAKKKQKEKVAVHTEKFEGSHQHSHNEAYVVIRAYDNIAAGWIYDRFNNNDALRIEIQRNDKQKIVIECALIYMIKAESPTDLTIEVSARNFYFSNGKIDLEDMTKEKVIFN